MKSDNKLITKVFTRLSNELHAMGAVSREAFWHVADRFLGITRENDRVGPEHLWLSLRKEGRAEKLFRGHQTNRESAEKPLSPGLLKETRPQDASKELLKQEQRQRRDERLQQDRQAKQVLEDQQRFVEKERVKVKQKDLSM